MNKFYRNTGFILASVSMLALTACGDDTPKSQNVVPTPVAQAPQPAVEMNPGVSADEQNAPVLMKSVDDCVAGGNDISVCQMAFANAQKQYVTDYMQNGEKFTSVAQCEAALGAGACTVQKVEVKNPDGSVGFMDVFLPVMTGMMVGSMLGNMMSGPSYYPVYRDRYGSYSSYSRGYDRDYYNRGYRSYNNGNVYYNNKSYSTPKPIGTVRAAPRVNNYTSSNNSAFGSSTTRPSNVTTNVRPNVAPAPAGSGFRAPAPSQQNVTSGNSGFKAPPATGGSPSKPLVSPNLNLNKAPEPTRQPSSGSGFGSSQKPSPSTSSNSGFRAPSAAPAPSKPSSSSWGSNSNSKPNGFGSTGSNRSSSSSSRSSSSRSS